MALLSRKVSSGLKFHKKIHIPLLKFHKSLHFSCCVNKEASVQHIMLYHQKTSLNVHTYMMLTCYIKYSYFVSLFEYQVMVLFCYNNWNIFICYITIEVILTLYNFCISPAAQYSEVLHSDYKYGSNGPNSYYNNGPYRPAAANWQPPHQMPVQGM